MNRLVLTLLLSTTTFFASNSQIVIVGGDATEAFNSIPSDNTVGNPCGVPNFTNLFINGDYTLPNNLFIQDAVLTIYGNLDKNGFEVTLLCDDSRIVIEGETLSIPNESVFDEFTVYPNPTNGIFHVKTSKPYIVNVYNMNGDIVSNTPDLSSLSSGVYLAYITIGDISTTRRIIRK